MLLWWMPLPTAASYRWEPQCIDWWRRVDNIMSDKEVTVTVVCEMWSANTLVSRDTWNCKNVCHAKNKQTENPVEFHISTPSLQCALQMLQETTTCFCVICTCFSEKFKFVCCISCDWMKDAINLECDLPLYLMRNLIEDESSYSEVHNPLTPIQQEWGLYYRMNMKRKKNASE